MTFMRTLLTNHPLVNVLFLVVLVMGALSYFQMPREQDPEISFNWVNIQVFLAGASAQDVEELVTSPIEDSIRQVQDVKFLTSTSREGVSNILVRFRELSERDFDKRLTDLRREVQAKANDELPDDAEDPLITEITTSNGFPTALVVLVGQANDERLRREARRVRDDLKRIKGVDSVTSLGLAEPEMHIDVDPVALAANGLTAADVADQIQRSFRNVFAGTTEVSSSEWLLRISGTTNDPEELAEYSLAPPGSTDRYVRLGDVARVSRGRDDPAQLVTFGGRPAISLSLTKVAYTNTLELIDAVNAYIAERNEIGIAQGFELILADDQTVPTRQALSVMQRNAALGLGLVLLVCWAFLGWRIAAMVTLGLMFSIAGTMWLLRATGNTLNVSVLLGIVIVLGMLVDDAVVVVEAIYYRLQKGQDALAASLSALREVAKPVTSAVSTTVAAFLPLMLLPGIVGDFMFVIPFVVTVGLAVSLVEAFWILPAHVIAFAPKGSVIQSGAQRDWRTRATQSIRRRYARSLIFVMRRPCVFLTCGILALAGAGLMVASGAVRTDFFSSDPLRIFYIDVDIPTDAPLTETLAMAQRAERSVWQHMDRDEVRAVTVLAGLKFTETEMLIGDQYAQVQVSLNPKEPGSREVNEIVEASRETVLATPGDGRLAFFEVAGGPPTGKPINVKVRSDDFVELRAAADAVLEIVADIEGTRDVADDEVSGRSELVFNIDERAVRDAGLDPGEVARLFRLHVDGEVIAFIRSNGEKLELRVRGPQRELDSVTKVLDDPVRLASGGYTTFRALGDFDITRGRGTIAHYNYRRAIAVSADLDLEVESVTRANERIRERWQDIRGQYPGADLDFTGMLDDIEESLSAMLPLMLMGLGFIYLILATQFRSYWQPFLILTTVPMAFTGVVIGLLITRNPLSLWTLYGVIALTGIAVNAAIVLIDAANARIAAGMRPLHATIYAGRRRIVPVLMTTMTTIAGLFSLALGLGGKSLLWGPVASSIVAGLLFASMLTLYLVPVLYRLFMRNHGRPRGTAVLT
ncbi:MAG: efflux RND transporter permease subunit [Gammaproteobacteria bacterium]